MALRLSIVRTIIFIGLIAAFTASGQDIPMFSQKLTNSFIYNPSFAGNNMGSFTFSHRNNYSGVQGAPKNNFLSFHVPFANHRFGFGANLFQEEVTALRTIYGSAAFSYHIIFNKYSSLSFGLAGEFNSVRLTQEGNKANDGSDLVLARYGKGVNTPDFSFGVNYQNQYLKIGLAANRLRSAWFESDSTRSLSNYYSALVQGTIPIGGSSVLEPYLVYRKFSESNQGYGAGLYFTYNDKITAGAGARSGGVVNATLAYKITKTLTIGYTREMIMGSVGGYTGASNEFVIRLDFANKAAKTSYRADYKSALSYRKKTLATGSARKKTAGGKNPKQLHKAQKRVAAYSPNSRYQNMKKLSHRSKSQGKSSSFNKSRKKPKYNKNRNKKVRRR